MLGENNLHQQFIEVYSSLFRLREEGSIGRQVNVQEHIDVCRMLFSLLLTAVIPEWVTLELSLTQVNVLIWLANREITTIEDMANQFGMSLTTAGHLVDHLTQVGLIARSEDTGDQRDIFVALTSRGKELSESLWVSFQRRAVALLQALDEDDQLVLTKGFQAITRFLGNELDNLILTEIQSHHIIKD